MAASLSAKSLVTKGQFWGCVLESHGSANPGGSMGRDETVVLRPCQEFGVGCDACPLARLLQVPSDLDGADLVAGTDRLHHSSDIRPE